MLSSTLSTAIRRKARVSSPISSTSRKSRSYCTGSRDSRDSSEGAEYTRHTESGDRERRGVPDKGNRAGSKQNNDHRATLSILSPLNRTAFGIGNTGVIIFAGQPSTGDRYVSWPRADTCKLLPPGARPPYQRRFQETSVTGMISEAQTRATDFLSGRGNSRYTVSNRASGKTDYHVRVGDELIPNSVILTVGHVNYIHQPTFTNKKNFKLFVANLLLERETGGDIPAGFPLIVAVYDPLQIPRYENYIPSRELTRTLGSDWNGFGLR